MQHSALSWIAALLPVNVARPLGKLPVGCDVVTRLANKPSRVAGNITQISRSAPGLEQFPAARGFEVQMKLHVTRLILQKLAVPALANHIRVFDDVVGMPE